MEKIKLTPEQRLEGYEFARKMLISYKEWGNHGFICEGLHRYLVTCHGIYLYVGDIPPLFPELLKQKPFLKTRGSAWWPIIRTNKRISVLDECIRKVTEVIAKNKANVEKNNR